MKIVFDNGEASISKTPMAFACCDKCENPSYFSLGFINEPLRNEWDKEEHKYCEKCGAIMDWDSLDIPKSINTYEEEIRADERAKVIDDAIECVKQLIVELDVCDCTKYGNKNADQQAKSYDTLMKYEIASSIDDLLDRLEQLKS